MATIPFPYPDDLTRFPKETQRVLRMVHDLGWTLRWQGSNRNVVTARCPSGDKTINFPRTNINANRVKSWLHMIERYSDPERFAEWVEDNAKKIEQEQKTAPTPSPAQKRADKIATWERSGPETTVAAAMRAAAEKAVDVMRPAAEAVILSRTRDSASPDDYVPADTTVVTEKPWLARRGSGGGKVGRVYESPHVVERHWSDGSVDYRCRWCPYTNSAGRSVATHARVHPERKVPQPAGRLITHYEPTEIRKPLSAVRRLSSDLLHALDTIDGWQSMSRDELAHLLAERVYDVRPDREPAEPLTPEQIIARIVGLVDQGRLADLHHKIDEMAASMVEATEARNRLTGEVTALQQRVAAAESEAERLHEERRVLRDLLSESEAAS